MTSWSDFDKLDIDPENCKTYAQCVKMCLKAEALKRCAWKRVCVFTLRSDCHSAIRDPKINFKNKIQLSLIGLTASGLPQLVCVVSAVLLRTCAARSDERDYSDCRHGCDNKDNPCRKIILKMTMSLMTTISNVLG